jgi:hypothetical protein
MKTPTKTPTKKPNPKQAREDALAEARKKMPVPTDPLSPEALKPLALRLGLPLLLLWIGAFVIQSWIPKAIMGVITLALAGLAIWAIRYARRSRAVASIVRDAAGSAEGRKEAIEKLDAEFKKDDTEATLAKAQLQLQEDPRAALATLETIKLDKVMAPVADQTRSMRGMIHLMLGETDEARVMADGIDLSRHKDAKTRASMAAVIGEAWARTGQAKKAVELLETLDPNDEAYADLRPQLFRARAFAYAWASNTKQMKQTLRRLAQLDPQYMSFFITRKKVPTGVAPRGVHPLLEQEAFDIVKKSGVVQRRMEIKRG